MPPSPDPQRDHQGGVGWSGSRAITHDAGRRRAALVVCPVRAGPGSLAARQRGACFVDGRPAPCWLMGSLQPCSGASFGGRSSLRIGAPPSSCTIRVALGHAILPTRCRIWLVAPGEAFGSAAIHLAAQRRRCTRERARPSRQALAAADATPLRYVATAPPRTRWCTNEPDDDPARVRAAEIDRLPGLA